MSQDVSTNQTVLDDLENSVDPSNRLQPEVELGSLGDGSPRVTASVNHYADSLMDELFEDVNQILARGAALPAEPTPPEFVSLQPIAMPRLILPPMLMPRSQIAIQAEAELEELVETDTHFELSPPDTSPAINRFLLVAVFASAIAAIASWFLFHGQPQTATPVTTTADTGTLKAQSDAQFTDYMQRSLAAIDRRTAPRSAALPAGTAVNPAMPDVAVASSTAPTTPTVLERVYVPVYQPPQTLYAQPNLAATAPSAAPVAAAPMGEARSQTIAPAPLPASASAAAAPSAPRVATAPAAPAVPHVLVGVMQLGDRSAALFEVNGIAQRSYIGESIGTSGWTLVSVSNQEAMIRRNGEVRSIYVGQQL